MVNRQSHLVSRSGKNPSPREGFLLGRPYRRLYRKRQGTHSRCFSVDRRVGSGDDCQSSNCMRRDIKPLATDPGRTRGDGRTKCRTKGDVNHSGRSPGKDCVLRVPCADARLHEPVAQRPFGREASVFHRPRLAQRRSASSRSCTLSAPAPWNVRASSAAVAGLPWDCNADRTARA